MALLIRGFEQESKRDFEHVGDLQRIRLYFEGRLYPSDDRRHAISGYRFVFGERAEQTDALSWQRDFFRRFT